MVLMTKNRKKVTCNLLMHKGRPSYRRRTSSTSKLPFKFLNFLYLLCGAYCPTASAFSSALQMRIHADPGTHTEPNISFSVQMTSTKCRKLKLEYLDKNTYFSVSG
jgi:hypothetical protein